MQKNTVRNKTLTLPHLACVLAYEEAVARAPDVLPALGRVPDGRGLPAEVALYHVLVSLARDVDVCLADAAGDTRGVPGHGAVVGGEVEGVNHHHLRAVAVGGGGGA